jgi:hypothetical protein
MHILSDAVIIKEVIYQYIESSVAVKKREARKGEREERVSDE